MRTEEIITRLFCIVDAKLSHVKKHQDAHLHPSEIVTIGVLFSLKGVHFRAFYRCLAAARPDIVFDISSLNPPTGQPAIDPLIAALQAGAHAVTANKGPTVHAYEQLRDLAIAQGKQLRFEASRVIVKL